MAGSLNSVLALLFRDPTFESEWVSSTIFPIFIESTLYALLSGWKLLEAHKHQVLMEKWDEKLQRPLCTNFLVGMQEEIHFFENLGALD